MTTLFEVTDIISKLETAEQVNASLRPIRNTIEKALWPAVTKLEKEYAALNEKMHGGDLEGLDPALKDLSSIPEVAAVLGANKALKEALIALNAGNLIDLDVAN